MKIAIAYAGHLGNFPRIINCIKKYIVCDSRISEWKIFFAVQSLKKNRMRYRDITNNYEIAVNGPYYNKDYIISSIGLEHFGGIRVMDEEEDYAKEYEIESKKFVNRTFYSNPYSKNVINYDFINCQISSSEVGSIFGQFFHLKIASEMIEKSNMKFDYIIRFRDRHIWKVNFNWDLMHNCDILCNIGSKYWCLELPLAGKFEKFISFCKSYAETVGGFRLPDETRRLSFNNTDLTFASECQFALFILNSNYNIKRYLEVYWNNVLVDPMDGLGPFVLQECDGITKFELELELKNM